MRERARRWTASVDGHHVERNHTLFAMNAARQSFDCNIPLAIGDRVETGRVIRDGVEIVHTADLDALVASA